MAALFASISSLGENAGFNETNRHPMTERFDVPFGVRIGFSEIYRKSDPSIDITNANSSHRWHCEEIGPDLTLEFLDCGFCAHERN
jgi:hypothetical protein